MRRLPQIAKRARAVRPLFGVFLLGLLVTVLRIGWAVTVNRMASQAREALAV